MKFVGVTGTSGSGKSKLADSLVTVLKASGHSATLVQADWFYHAPVLPHVAAYVKGAADPAIFGSVKAVRRTIDELRGGGKVPPVLAPLQAAEAATMLETQLSIDAATYNWDVPTAMDIAGMQRTLLRLRAGETVDIYAFNFATRQRDRRVQISPADFVVVEGLFVLQPELHDIIAHRLYVHASQETTWRRKLARDSHCGRGGHDPKYLRTQFELAWRMSQQHVVPSMRLPGVVVVDNDELHSDEAAWEATVGSIVRELKSQPAKASLSKMSQAQASAQAHVAVVLAAIAVAHTAVRGSRGVLPRVATTLAAAALIMAVGAFCWRPRRDVRPRMDARVTLMQDDASDESSSVAAELKHEIAQCRTELSAVGSKRVALRQQLTTTSEGTAGHDHLQQELLALDVNQLRLIYRIQQSEQAMRSHGISHARDR